MWGIILSLLPSLIKLIIMWLEYSGKLPKAARKVQCAKLNQVFADALQSGDMEAMGRQLALWQTECKAEVARYTASL